jgi:pimeloyl-ACP methyl ester carboxylesterase
MDDGYVEANGVRMWCAHAGNESAQPVLLLHGGFEHGEAWGPQIPALSAGRRLIIPDRRGHGRTADVEGPITYDLMRDDMVSLLEALGPGPVDVVGFSDGANVGMLLALARPDLVRRLVLVGGNHHYSGCVPELFAFIEDDASEASLRAMYDAVSPDGPDHFPVLRDKLLRMWREEPTLTDADLGAITAPILVLGGDDDLVSLEHLVAQYRAIPHSQLAIVPGTSHMLLFERTDLANRLITEFLDGGEPATLIPVRRR